MKVAAAPRQHRDTTGINTERGCWRNRRARNGAIAGDVMFYSVAATYAARLNMLQYRCRNEHSASPWRSQRVARSDNDNIKNEHKQHSPVRHRHCLLRYFRLKCLPVSTSDNERLIKKSN